MELLYLYIPEYKSIKDCEYNFSNRYKFSRKIEGKNILIDLIENDDSKNQWQSNFFGQKISNLSVIVGANGSGKSSLLQFINEEISKNGNSKGYNFIAVFEKNKKLLIKKRSEKIEINPTFDHKGNSEGMAMIQYYPLSDLTFNNEYLLNQIGADRINISDNAMFYADFEREQNENRNSINQTGFQDALSSYAISNIERELEFFLNDKIGEIRPPHVLALETIDIEKHIADQIQSYEETIRKYENDASLRDSFQRTFVNLLYLNNLLEGEGGGYTQQYKIVRTFVFMLLMDVQFHLDTALGQIADASVEKLQESTSKEMLKILKELEKIQNKNTITIEDFILCLQKIGDLEETNLNISSNANNIHLFLTKHLVWAINATPKSKAAHVIFDLEKLVEETKKGKIFVFFDDYPEESKAFVRQLKKITFMSRIMTYEWKANLSGTYSYSTGELQMIKLFSRLNYGLNSLESKLKDGVLIMLDEAELAMHPEWQKKFTNWLLQFLNENRREKSRIQLILTTHSPLMLSDIPSQNVIKITPQGVDNSDISSFAANFYNLLKSSFFFEDQSYVGSFAMAKINTILNYIHKEDFNEDKHFLSVSITNLIGDQVIKSKLLELLYNKSPISAVDNNKLERLRKQREHLDIIISKIENDIGNSEESK